MQFPGARTKEMATNAYYNIRNGLKAGRDKTVSRHKQRKWKIQSKIQSTIARLTGRDQKVNQFLHGALALQLENQQKEQLNKLYEVFSKRKTQLNTYENEVATLTNTLEKVANQFHHEELAKEKREKEKIQYEKGLLQEYFELANQNGVYSRAAGNHTPSKTKQPKLYTQWKNNFEKMKGIEKEVRTSAGISQMEFAQYYASFKESYIQKPQEVSYQETASSSGPKIIGTYTGERKCAPQEDTRELVGVGAG